MYAYARDSGGRLSGANFLGTFFPFRSTTTNLPVAFTHPPGVAPTGTFSKSILYGSFGATRTRARPVRPFTVASTYPCWPGTSAATVSLPSATWAFNGGGCKPAGVFGGVGSDHWAGDSLTKFPSLS